MSKSKAGGDQARLRCARRLKQQVFGQYCPSDLIVCAGCQIADLDVLTLDHINNDGEQHRREIFGHYPYRPGSGIPMWGWLRRNDYPPGFQVLCFNCNIRKARTGLIGPESREASYRWWQAKITNRPSPHRAEFRRRMQVLSHYSGGVAKCKECGEGDLSVLCLYGQQGPLSGLRKRVNAVMGNVGGGSRNLYKWLVDNNFPPLGIIVLCMNCIRRKWAMKRVEDHQLAS